MQQASPQPGGVLLRLPLLHKSPEWSQTSPQAGHEDRHARILPRSTLGTREVFARALHMTSETNTRDTVIESSLTSDLALEWLSFDMAIQGNPIQKGKKRQGKSSTIGLSLEAFSREVMRRELQSG
eukprot:1859775-Amphidinium_carterae.1